MPGSLLTVRQAADRLRVSPTVLQYWLWQGKLPSVKVGRAWRIDPADLAAEQEREIVRLGEEIERQTKDLERRDVAEESAGP